MASINHQTFVGRTMCTKLAANSCQLFIAHQSAERMREPIVIVVFFSQVKQVEFFWVLFGLVGKKGSKGYFFLVIAFSVVFSCRSRKSTAKCLCANFHLDKLLDGLQSCFHFLFSIF